MNLIWIGLRKVMTIKTMQEIVINNFKLVKEQSIIVNLSFLRAFEHSEITTDILNIKGIFE